MPVTKQMPKAMPSAVPTRALSSVPRARLVKSSGLGSRFSMSATVGSLISGPHQGGGVAPAGARGADDGHAGLLGDGADRVQPDDGPLEVRRQPAVDAKPAAIADEAV